MKKTWNRHFLCGMHPERPSYLLSFCNLSDLRQNSFLQQLLTARLPVVDVFREKMDLISLLSSRGQQRLPTRSPDQLQLPTLVEAGTAWKQLLAACRFTLTQCHQLGGRWPTTISSFYMMEQCDSGQVAVLPPCVWRTLFGSPAKGTDWLCSVLLMLPFNSRAVS